MLVSNIKVLPSLKLAVNIPWYTSGIYHIGCSGIVLHEGNVCSSNGIEEKPRVFSVHAQPTYKKGGKKKDMKKNC